MRKIIVGVDGGGTKSRFAALDALSGEVIAGSESGSIHTLSLGIDEAARQLKAGVEALGIEREELVCISIGDPSLDDCDPSDGEPLREAARALCAPGGVCFSKSDVFMALYGLSRGAPAALLVSGTGSMGVALTGSGVVSIGGWGEPVRDPGSGYWIAAEALGAAMNAFDGVGEPTALCGEALSFFGVREPRELIGVFNRPEADRAYVAAFAPRVEVCAENGDAAAGAILGKAGRILGDYGAALLAKLGGESPVLGVYGGILLNCRPVREACEKRVRERFPDAAIVEPPVPPQVAAALYAADRLAKR